jgi:hypothetical protein
MGMEVEEMCLELLVELQDKDVVLNTTRGTKVMTFADLEVS